MRVPVVALLLATSAGCRSTEPPVTHAQRTTGQMERFFEGAPLPEEINLLHLERARDFRLESRETPTGTFLVIDDVLTSIPADRFPSAEGFHWTGDLSIVATYREPPQIILWNDKTRTTKILCVGRLERIGSNDDYLLQVGHDYAQYELADIDPLSLKPRRLWATAGFVSPRTALRNGTVYLGGVRRPFSDALFEGGDTILVALTPGERPQVDLLDRTGQLSFVQDFHRDTRTLLSSPTLLVPPPERHGRPLGPMHQWEILNDKERPRNQLLATAVLYDSTRRTLTTLGEISGCIVAYPMCMQNYCPRWTPHLDLSWVPEVPGLPGASGFSPPLMEPVTREHDPCGDNWVIEETNRLEPAAADTGSDPGWLRERDRQRWLGRAQAINAAPATR